MSGRALRTIRLGAHRISHSLQENVQLPRGSRPSIALLVLLAACLSPTHLSTMPQFEEPTTTDTPVSATNAESEATLEASDTHGEVAAGSPGKCTKGIPWKIPTVEERLEQRRMMYTDDERKEAWSDTAGKIKTYSDEMVARWNSEMDTLLVYAGLFSAILTAFNVQSYQLLTPDPPDPVLAALQQISSQLNSFSVSSPFVNSTQQVFPAPISPPPPDRSSIWLNVLWFSSLIFSLSAASVGIMVKQWLNEYNTGLSGTSLQTVRLRQYRLNSLVKWHVAEIVAVLPVLLQIALTLFFAGLLVLLFTLNQAVAIVASVLVGALAVFNLYTTLLPTLTKDCCYLSPPANAVASAALAIRLTYRSLVMGLQSTLFKLSLRHHHYIPISFSMCILEASNLVKDHCKKISVLTLRDKELHNVITSGDALDADTVLMAYTTTMDRTHLQRAAAVFSDRPSIPMHFFLSLEAFNAQYVKVGKDSVTQDIPDELWSDGLLAALRSGMTPSPDKEKESGSEWGRIRSRLLFMRPHDATQGNCLISNLSVVLASDPNSRLKNLLYDKLETMRKRQLELQDDTRMLLTDSDGADSRCARRRRDPQALDTDRDPGRGGVSRWRVLRRTLAAPALRASDRLHARVRRDNPCCCALRTRQVRGYPELAGVQETRLRPSRVGETPAPVVRPHHWGPTSVPDDIPARGDRRLSFPQAC
ncbi:hypothetical protein C8Q80DRAFT_1191645 [Daedaleopsis nitida]|nr:hypothetical protein C8Q80DRAFT_1191645 [Daedaleopsis nitida]